MMSKGSLFVISAPSGTGKTTILKKIMAEVERLTFSVSHTTRQPRKGERDGVDYHFVDKPAFVGMREQGDFLEWAEVHGNFYGTSQAEVEKQLAAGIDVVLDIDVQGAQQVRDIAVDAVTIFIAPPSWEEQKKRLMARGTDSAATIELRLANGRREMEDVRLYQYLIINETVDEAADILRAIILARRSATRRSADGLALQILSSFL